MELDEMKSLWGDMSKKMEKQALLNEKLILQITKEKFSDKMGSIFLSELTATIFCYIFLIFILMGFHKLDTCI